MLAVKAWTAMSKLVLYLQLFTALCYLRCLTCNEQSYCSQFVVHNVAVLHQHHASPVHVINAVDNLHSKLLCRPHQSAVQAT